MRSEQRVGLEVVGSRRVPFNFVPVPRALYGTGYRRVSPTARFIWTYLHGISYRGGEEHEPIYVSYSTIADRCGISSNTVSPHITELKEIGLLHVEAGAGRRGCHRYHVRLPIGTPEEAETPTEKLLVASCDEISLEPDSEPEVERIAQPAPAPAVAERPTQISNSTDPNSVPVERATDPKSVHVLEGIPEEKKNLCDSLHGTSKRGTELPDPETPSRGPRRTPDPERDFRVVASDRSRLDGAWNAIWDGEPEELRESPGSAIRAMIDAVNRGAVYEDLVTKRSAYLAACKSGARDWRFVKRLSSWIKSDDWQASDAALRAIASCGKPATNGRPEPPRTYVRNFSDEARAAGGIQAWARSAT